VPVSVSLPLVPIKSVMSVLQMKKSMRYLVNGMAGEFIPLK